MDDNLKEKIKKVFIRFDVNRDGFLNLNELNKYLDELYKNVKIIKTRQEVIDKIMTKYDYNKDNKISLDEFYNFFW